MPFINKESRDDVYFDLEMHFMDALELADHTYKEIAMVDRTNKPLKKYKWMESLPKMVEWKGNREMHKLEGAGHEIGNRDFAVGIEVDRDDMDDDAGYVQVSDRIRGLGALGPEAVNDEVVSYYVNGFTDAKGVCYDGQFLFDTDHTISASGDGATFSNKGTAAFSTSALDAAFVQMLGWTDPKGRKLKVRPTKILFGPALFTAVREALSLQTLSGGGVNPHYHMVEPVLSQEITGNEWFLLDTRNAARAVIAQIRRDAEFRAPVTSLEEESAFMTKEYKFGVDMTFGCGYGPWFLAWGSDASS